MKNKNRQCQKCYHIRTEYDPKPYYSCPKCGAVYEKVEQRLINELQERHFILGKKSIEHKNNSPQEEEWNFATFLVKTFLVGMGMMVVFNQDPDTRYLAGIGVVMSIFSLWIFLGLAANLTIHKIFDSFFDNKKVN